MQIGMIGLGKMGSNMARRLLRADHRVIGFDLDPEAARGLEEAGGAVVSSLEALAAQLDPPRICWLMLPAGDPVDQTIDALLPLLGTGDILVDGGNSNYRDTLRRAGQIHDESLHFIDVGTSGGVWGLEGGFSLMVGGDAQVVDDLRPIFETLAPGPDKGWNRVGSVGSGHFVKMIHNGIEYGLMQAYAEGFAIMEAKEEFDLDLHQVAETWRFGSVIRSWLLDLTSRALADDAELSTIAPYVSDSGEGRWTVKEAIDLDVPAPIITGALMQRLESREKDSYAYKILAAMRSQFGGHAVPSVEEGR